MSALARPPITGRLPWLRRLVAVGWLVAVAAAPLFLISSNVVWAFGAPGLYTYGFQKYRISQEMLMPSEELERIAAGLRAYWTSDADHLNVTYAGRPFFNQREIVHLRDVKAIVQGVDALRWTTLGVLLAWVAMTAVLLKVASTREFARAAAWGGGLTLGIVAFCGVVFLFAFDQAFLLFHRLSFANDFWQLTCPGDNLVCLFPQGFWFDATMFIVVATVVEAALLLVGGLAALRVLRRVQFLRPGAVPGSR
ncbi:MAG: DUF1461 domain-containing protein [SAR202 cluster bacterium]|nr:DUF1461 domain-containing protein [SAR202 cluster bacterium]